MRRLCEYGGGVHALAAVVLVALQGWLLEVHPARLCVGGRGRLRLRRKSLRTLLRPMPELAASKARRRLGAVARKVTMRVAVTADHLGARTRPMPKLAAACALVARARIPPTVLAILSSGCG